MVPTKRFPVWVETVVSKGADYRLPLFGSSVLLYTAGLIVGLITAGGNLGRAILLGLAAVLFFFSWWLFGKPQHAKLLHEAGLALVIALSLIGLLILPNLDDDYLRTNSLSASVLKLASSILPHSEMLVMHRNTLAGMLAIFAPLAMAYTLIGKGWRIRICGGISFGLMLGELLVTNSRGSLAALAVGLLLLGILVWQRGSKRLQLILGVLALVTVTTMAFYLAVSGQYRLFNPQTLLNDGGLSRLEVWQDTIYILSDVPLTGMGIGEYKNIYPFPRDPLNDLVNLGNYGSQEHAHNLILQCYVELGLFGLLAALGATALWLTLLFQLLAGKKSWQGIDLTPNGNKAVPFMGGMAAMAALQVYGATEYSSWNGQFAPLFWIPTALIACSCTIPFRAKSKYSWKPKLRRYFLFAVPVSLLLIVGCLWQFWGLAEVNAASLEKFQYWREQQKPSLLEIQKKYENASSILGWDSATERGLGWVFLQRNLLSQAEQHLKMSLKNNPEDRPSLLMLGEALEKEGRPMEAMEIWKQAKASILFYWRGRQLLDSQNDLEAEPFFLKAIALNPQHWESYTALEMFYIRHSRLKEAMSLMEHAKAELPDRFEPVEELNKLKEMAMR